MTVGGSRSHSKKIWKIVPKWSYSSTDIWRGLSISKGKGKGSFYIAQYPVRWTAQSALHFIGAYHVYFVCMYVIKGC